MLQVAVNTVIYALLAKFILNDVPHALGLTEERPTWYIKSKPPSTPYLYHHSTYSGLKRIAERWSIEAPPVKQTISLTTDPGRFLSPLPFIAAVTIDGVVKMPYDDTLQAIAIPALYRTHSAELVGEARSKTWEAYAKEELPPEYKYIMPFVVHGDMFIDENEYVVLARHLNAPVTSIIYVHPSKLKRFKAGLSEFAMRNIQSLEELAR